jgi:hypothetical protein
MQLKDFGVAELDHAQMTAIDGGSEFWNDFWDGVLVDTQDILRGFAAGSRGN